MKIKLDTFRICLGIIAIILLQACSKDAFTQSGHADDHFFLKSGSQHMPVSVIGNIDSKKFIVIIHGGPGGNGIIYRDAYVKEKVEKEYAIVYWDQRYAGNTQGKNDKTDITDFKNDIKNLLLLLQSKYGSEHSFYLMGHSWGGFLTPYFLLQENNQKLVKGWIQVGGAHNYRMNDSLTREMLIYHGQRQIAANKNVADWDEIVAWCAENGFESREEAGTLNAFAHRAESLIDSVLAPSYFPEVKRNALLTQWSNGIASALRQIDNPTYTTPISENLSLITLPTLLLWGKYDFVCPPTLAQDIIQQSQRSNIQFILYDQSGHSPMANEPESFWSDVIDWIKTH